MSNSTVLNVKIDKELKKRAQETAKEVGVPMSIVVAASLKDFIRTRTLMITDLPQLRPEVVAELRKLEKDINKREDLSPPFDDLEEAFTWLDSDGK